VRENVRQMINRIGKGEGYMLGPSHDALTDARVQNIAALIEQVRNQSQGLARLSTPKE